ncbi:MAG: hypothetical protein WDO15_13940 [Bacteroidota bacterium]
MVESTLLTFVAFVLSLILAWLLVPYFNNLALQHLSIPFSKPLFYVIFIGIALLIGVAAGIYPSFFLSAFKPVKVLKGQVSFGSRTSFVRSSLGSVSVHHLDIPDHRKQLSFNDKSISYRKGSSAFKRTR